MVKPDLIFYIRKNVKNDMPYFTKDKTIKDRYENESFQEKVEKSYKVVAKLFNDIWFEVENNFSSEDIFNNNPEMQKTFEIITNKVNEEMMKKHAPLTLQNFRLTKKVKTTILKNNK